jgi:hypothetical protein
MYRSLPGGFLACLCAQLFLPGCSGAPASDTNEQGLVGVYEHSASGESAVVASGMTFSFCVC